MNFSCPIVFSVGSETSSKLFCKGARAVRTRKFNCHLDSTQWVVELRNDASSLNKKPPI